MKVAINLSWKNIDNYGGNRKMKMTKKQIINTMKKWYMPNFFDVSMFDYTQLNDEEIYQVYLEEIENWGEEINEELEKHI